MSINSKITVYRQYTNGKTTFSLRKLVDTAGHFEFVGHPDDCPEGQWQYYPSTGVQPSYYWLNRNEPRRAGVW